MVDDKTVFVLIIMKLTYVLGYHDQGIFYLHQPFCNRSGADLIPKSDCTGFYICSDGLTYEETCQDGWVFSHGAHGCVPRGSFIDDCGKYWAYKSYYGNRASPCSYRNPICEGLPNGENLYPEREWSPQYISCFKGRTIGSGNCPSLNISDMAKTQLFHPDLRMCVPLYRIPKEHGGYLPDCSNKVDGSYPIDSNLGSPRYYFICMHGEFDDVYSCPDEMLFDASLRDCVDQSTTDFF